jgi:hypothetical protein
MKTFFQVFLLLIFILSGCSSNKMVVYRSSPESKKMSKTVYENYFKYSGYIYDDKLKIDIRANMIEKHEAFYGLKAAIGALGPDDMYADADISITLTNTSEEVLDIELWDFYIWDDDLMGKRYEPIDHPKQSFLLAPKRFKVIKVNQYEIGHYCEKIFIKFHYEIDNKKTEKLFEVERVQL